MWRAGQGPSIKAWLTSQVLFDLTASLNSMLEGLDEIVDKSLSENQG